MRFWKKLGHALLGLAPLPLSILIQFLLMIPVCGILFYVSSEFVRHRTIRYAL